MTDVQMSFILSVNRV